MSSKIDASLPAREVKILHLSDLHFGLTFDASSWENLCNKAVSLKPDLVIITGDLVNSPSIWGLRRAKRGVRRLVERLGIPQDRIIIVPGNHDTRVWGIMPIIPLWFFLGGAIALSLCSVGLHCAGWLIGSAILQSTAIGIYPVLSGLVAVRCCFHDFKRKFKEHIPPARRLFDDLGVEVFAFDSASKALYGARGRVPKKQFVKAAESRERQAQDGQDKDGVSSCPPFCIAILHHHPLPIPHASRREPLMVMDNAGVFLHEMAARKVRLVLHGHKHHEHFSRITINAGKEHEHDIAVLSTGTATAGSNGEHNFNLLKVNGLGNVTVIPYRASGGTLFRKESSFSIEQSAQVAKRYFEGVVKERGARVGAIIVQVDIGPDGDMYYRHEYHNLRFIKEDGAWGMPRPIHAAVDKGHIDKFEVGMLKKNSVVKINFVEDAKELTRRDGRIMFSRRVDHDYSLDIFSHYWALNSFAMSTQQAGEMYEQHRDTEDVRVKLLQAPSESLSIVIRFPKGFELESEPQLVIEDNEGQPRSDLENMYQQNVKYYSHLNVIMVHIPYPLLNVNYKIQWSLPQSPSFWGKSTEKNGEVETLAHQLLALADDDVAQAQLKELLNLIAEKVNEFITAEKIRKSLNVSDEDARRLLSSKIEPEPIMAEELKTVLGVSDKEGDKLLANITQLLTNKMKPEPINISLMVYDNNEHALRIVAANFEMSEEVRDFRLKYGDGVAGRAYKMNSSRGFNKKRAIEENDRSYYYPVNGRPYELEEIDDEIIVSIPLRHPGNEKLIYGVLNLSSNNSESKLQDLKGRAIEKLINKTCYNAYKDIILPDGR